VLRWSRLPGLLTLSAALVAVASAKGALPLQQRVLEPGELSGFSINGPVEIARSAKAWLRPVTPTGFKGVADLKAQGFVAAAREGLTGSNAQASSAVMEFKTARAARATVAQVIAGLREANYAVNRFSVPGIPGARAAATSAVNRKGFTIAFADGRFWYFVSVSYPPEAKRHPTRASVVAAARALYQRVHSG